MTEQTPTTTPATPATPAAPAASERRPSGPGGPKRRGFQPRRKVCRFCVDQVQDIDFKQIQVLRSFMTERGKMLGRRVTGVCARHQRQLAGCIKRARVMSLLPFVSS